MEYLATVSLEPDEYQELMDRGYRKFGSLVFRPVCADCAECRPIRIRVEDFRPDRSQRRAWNRNLDLDVQTSSPKVDAQRLALYHRYHAVRSAQKGWPETDKDDEEYRLSFLESPLPAVEITLWEGADLRAVVLTDVTPDSVSGVYHFYDPAAAERGLGTVCMLRTIELARTLGKRYAYFGYYVEGCGSLSYKARFRPCELLEPNGIWRPVE